MYADALLGELTILLVHTLLRILEEHARVLLFIPNIHKIIIYICPYKLFIFPYILCAIRIFYVCGKCNFRIDFLNILYFSLILFLFCDDHLVQQCHKSPKVIV